MNTRARVLVLCSCVVLGSSCVDDTEERVAETQQDLQPSPASAIAVPADYNGDGVTDVALKGDNVWYLDFGVCAAATGPNDPLPRPTRETACAGNIDDDNDGFINDGCPASGAAESLCDNLYDDDGDGLVNDGCPFCGTQNVYGGPWDFAYSGYGWGDATPVPADYGRNDNTVDPEHRVDFAIKTTGGMWAIDFADNGFGSFDRVYYGYGDGTAIPVPADYDGDGRADLAVKTSGGSWLIDYAANGYGAWDPPNRGCLTWPTFSAYCTQLPAIYGGSAVKPVPADYNGDGRADLAVKDPNVSYGQFKIDYSTTSNTGFGAWNQILSGYGNSDAVPVPFNYDPWRDNKADLAVKGPSGEWLIDYANDGFGSWNTACAGPSTACSSSPYSLGGYGGSWSQAVPGDYDGDGIVDLSAKDIYGVWYVDLGYNGWFGWDYWPGTTSIYMDNPNRVLYDATRPRIASTKVYGDNGQEVSQLVAGVRYTIDVIVQPGTGSDPLQKEGGVEVRSDIVSASLKIGARTGGTYVGDMSKDSQGNSISPVHRRFSLVCTQAGTFTLAFQIRNRPPYWGNPVPRVVNRDTGIAVTCLGPGPGIFGTVTGRVRDPVTGVFKAGAPLSGAQILVEQGGSGETATTLGDGSWSLPLTGGPYRLRIYYPGKSIAKIVNLTVPSTGMRVDVSLEQAFDTLALAGINYTMYIDYSAGRTILHTVKLNRYSSTVSIGSAISTLTSPGPESGPQCSNATDDAPADGYVNDGCPAVGPPETWISCNNNTDDDADGVVNDGCRLCTGPDFFVLKDLGAADPYTGVLINSTWWTYCNGGSQGYTYSATQTLDREVWCDDGYATEKNCSPASSTRYLAENGTDLYPGATGPMLTIAGTGSQQAFNIVEAPHNFFDTSSLKWNVGGSPPGPIWDVSPRDGVSDISYALEIPNPPLLRSGNVIAGGDFRYTSGASYDNAFARTTVGVSNDGNLYLVIADGENVQGGHGATANQMGHFYRDVLQATVAMGLDSALSTQMLLTTPSGLYRVNTVTGEDATIQVDPYTQTLDADNAGLSWGKVGFYLKARL